MACAYRPDTRGGSMISRRFRHDKRITAFSKELQRARWAARIIGSMHTLCRILAFYNVTWATVIVLGGFIDYLLSADYYIVFVLLLLEGSRLAYADFFTQLLTRAPNPEHLAYYEVRKSFTVLVRFLFFTIQALLIAPSLVCSSIRYHYINYPQRTAHMQISLRLFYILVILSAVVSTGKLLLSSLAWVYFQRLDEKSVLKYFDEVLCNTTVKGVVLADYFNFFHFAFRLLGREYESYKPWGRVVQEHDLLLLYLYAHKQGADYLQVCLDSEDAPVRQAAANTVGAWALAVGREVELPVELLSKLADTVGTGEVGWAAVSSFGALASWNNLAVVIKTRNSSGKPVLHRIVELVDGSSSRSLVCVRTLIFFYDKWLRQDASAQERLQWQPLSGPLEEHLSKELRMLLQCSPVQRLRVYAGYLLYLLNRTVVADAAFKLHVGDIAPSQDEVWYQIEKQMLEHLRTKVSLAPEPANGYPPDFHPNVEKLSPP